MIELATLVYFMTNRTELFESLHKVLEKYADKTNPQMHKQLKPIQDLLKCCGATIESKATFISEGLCDALQYAVRRMLLWSSEFCCLVLA